jgi:pSer/pThr/pTyr-binding forkhead associated (FHA) protein
MARLVLICDGDDLVAHKLGNITTIGRALLNHIVIDNSEVSGQHAIIAKLADSYQLQDLHSTNGTQVNGIPITEVELKDGDKIQFGSVVAVFTGGCR